MSSDRGESCPVRFKGFSLIASCSQFRLGFPKEFKGPKHRTDNAF